MCVKYKYFCRSTKSVEVFPQTNRSFMFVSRLVNMLQNYVTTFSCHCGWYFVFWSLWLTRRHEIYFRNSEWQRTRKSTFCIRDISWYIIFNEPIFISGAVWTFLSGILVICLFDMHFTFFFMFWTSSHHSPLHLPNYSLLKIFGSNRDGLIEITRLRFERRWYSARTLDKGYYTPTINNGLSR